MQANELESPASSGRDILNFEPELIRADVGKRFGNYIIDVIAYYLLAILVGVCIAIIFPPAIERLTDDRNSSFGLVDRLVSLLCYAIFMSLVEGICRGKSLGKLITGTRAVNLDGTRISFGTAFARGFSRAVPFCVFSAFGTPCDPWQDHWTNTMVIDDKKSSLIA